MKKKLFVEKKYNLGIIESYKPSTDKDSPILGSFEVKGMTVENMVSQNRTKYSGEVWAQPTSFGKGGKFIDESGQLRPSTLFGSLDHPTDGHVELLLKEAAIAWREVRRDATGRWDGVADILNKPEGRIVKTFLDYAKLRGGGDLFGVSSRALGESIMTESHEGQVEAIIPESFELMTFDFVYNPSFQTATAHLTESKKYTNKSILIESVRNLAKDDEEHSKLYENFAKKLEAVEEQLIKEEKEYNDMAKKKIKSKNYQDLIEASSIDKAKQVYLKELNDREKKLHDAIYDLKNMTDEEFSETDSTSRKKMIRVLQKDYEEILTELKDMEASLMVETKKEKEIKKVIKEAEELEDDLEDLEVPELDVEDTEETETEEDTEETEEETEEELPKDHHEAEETLLTKIVGKLEELIDIMQQAFAPVEDAEETDEEDELDEENTDEDETDEDTEETEEDFLDLSDEELAEMTDEELEYIASLEEARIAALK